MCQEEIRGGGGGSRTVLDACSIGNLIAGLLGREGGYCVAAHHFTVRATGTHEDARVQQGSEGLGAL
eukprot:scaffold101719_cov33-Tisochrysis_lutea.AAC.8